MNRVDCESPQSLSKALNSVCRSRLVEIALSPGKKPMVSSLWIRVWRLSWLCRRMFLQADIRAALSLSSGGHAVRGAQVFDGVVPGNI